MHTCTLQHVSVWLHGGPSDDSVFPHAMDWAFRLNLPVRAVVNSPRSDSVGRTRAAIAEKMKTWSMACSKRGTNLEMLLSLEPVKDAIHHFLRPHSICVFVENQSSQVQHELMVWSARTSEIAVLMCPPICTPMTRVLIL